MALCWLLPFILAEWCFVNGSRHREGVDLEMECSELEFT